MPGEEECALTRQWEGWGRTVALLLVSLLSGTCWENHFAAGYLRVLSVRWGWNVVGEAIGDHVFKNVCTRYVLNVSLHLCLLLISSVSSRVGKVRLTSCEESAQHPRVFQCVGSEPYRYSGERAARGWGWCFRGCFPRMLSRSSGSVYWIHFCLQG